MNLLLFLTALLTSLTGMISGERAAISRVQATAVAEQADNLAQAVMAPATIAQTIRPMALVPTLRQTNAALPDAFVLTSALRLTPEKRRE